MKNILVLCIGNICRSPMAEALLRKSLPNCTIRSAGIGALVGSPADPLAVRLMSEKGIDIREHRAQQISSQLVREADLILTMDLEQKTFVERNYVSTRGKVYRLCEATKQDVSDPYHEGIESFRSALVLIENGVSNFTNQLLRIG